MSKSHPLVVILLVVFGVARLVISWFPMDDPTTEHTATGRRHGLLAIVAFAAATIGAIRLGAILHGSEMWSGASTAFLTIGFAMLASMIVMGHLQRRPNLRGYFGLTERGFYLGTIAFMVLVGAELVRVH